MKLKIECAKGLIVIKVCFFLKLQTHTEYGLCIKQKARPDLCIHKTRPRSNFFWSKKENKTRPYLSIHIINLSDELYNEFYLIFKIIT